MIEATLIEENHGFSFDSQVLELDQMYMISDVQILAQITVRYDPDGPVQSMATAILFDNDGKQLEFTFRDFPSRWWSACRTEMGMYPEVPTASMTGIAASLIDRVTAVLRAFNGA